MKIAKLALVALALLPLSSVTVQAETIATVNGVTINDVMLDMFAGNRLRKDPAQLTPEEKQQATDELIQLFVIGTAAKKAGLHKDPKTAAQLELQSMSFLAQTLVQKHVKDNPVTPEMLESAYQSFQGEPKLEYKARHILVASPTEAQEIIAKLDAGGDFTALAAEHSTGPTAQKGGDLGWFSPAQMVKPFSDAVAVLNDGQHSSAPVQTQFGWHVILREQQRTLPPPDKDTVLAEIGRNIQQESVQAYLDDLKKKAKIKPKK